MSTPDDELSDARVRVSRRAKVWGWVGAGALLVVVSIYAWFAAQEPVRWKDVGFDILSPTEAEITFDVYLYEANDAVCHLRALNDNYAEVGVTDELVRFADGAQQRITTSFVTTEEATTAVVKYCEEVD
jgi:hypothetical protein